MITIHLFFFFNDTATTEIYTLSLHDALPISRLDEILESEAFPDYGPNGLQLPNRSEIRTVVTGVSASERLFRSEEHTSELQSRQYLVCRLLLEKKKKIY